MLPKATAGSIGKLLSAPKRSAKKISEAFVTALREAKFATHATSAVIKLVDLTDARDRGVMPRPSELDPVQRALAELLAYEDDAQLYFHDGARWQVFCIPETGANRRRWLGYEPGGLLDELMSYEVDGVVQEIPVWQAIQRAAFKDRWLKRFYDQFSIQRRLELMGALFPPSYGLNLGLASEEYFVDLSKLTDEGACWAPAYANALLARMPEAWRESLPIRVVLFRSMARGKVPFDPRWAPLFPLLGQPQSLPTMRECLTAIPPAQRESTLLAAMHDDMYFDTMFGARALLDDVPSKRLIEELFSRTDARGLPGLLSELESLSVRHPEIREALDDYRAKRSTKRIDLEFGKGRKPISADELSVVQQKQLCAFGRAYDGQKLTAKARLTPGKDIESGSFSGAIEIAPLFDKKSQKHLYDAFLTVDSGSFFKAGTTTQVAAIIQGGLEECKDPMLHEAIERALAAKGN